MGFEPQVTGPGAGAQEQLGQIAEALFGGVGTTRVGEQRRRGGRGSYTPTERAVTPEDLISFFTALTIPAFEGPFGAPATPLQTAAAGGIGEYIAGYDPRGMVDPLMEIATGGAREDIVGLLTAGEDVERRRIAEEQAALRERRAIGGTRRSIGTGRAEAELASRVMEAGRLGRETLAAQLFSAERGRELEAARALPGAAGTALAPYITGVQAGEAMRQISDVDILRRMAEFQRTQGALFGPLLGAVTGLPLVTAPGIGSQLLTAATTLGGAGLSGGFGAKPGTTGTTGTT